MPFDRRRFLASMAAAPMFVPRSAWGANDRVAYGLIAAGGRGRYLNQKFQALGARCVAICDVYQPYIDLAKKDSPDAKTFIDYNELLAEPGIDAVVLAGPDHHHCPMLLASLKAKKDVYAEKPLSWSLEESDIMVKAVRNSDRIVQIGMQRRSAPSILRAKSLVDEGLLGKITLVKPQWHWNVSRPLDNSALAGNLDWQRFLGSAPKRDLEPMRFRRWRVFKDYAGGNMTDQGTHLMDVVQWFTRSGPPVSAVAQGYVAKMEGAEHPDVFSAVFEFKDFMATWTLDYCNAYENGWSITFMGDEGTMILDEEGFRVYAEPWDKNPEPIFMGRSPVPVESHIQNFLDCTKSRQQPTCTVEIAAAAVSGPHLANLAMFQGRKVKMSEVTKTS
ncbi:MAG: Gfo/Idh/MocA family oxidoreductase [Bryobacteraceae bacterium]|nr:Gfo/Idh/MocA family oxidoreductase [Bryobacteraceae bacterium]